MTISISSKKIRELRAKLHNLKPIVIIGNNGLTENVLEEIKRGLNDHELIKTRIAGDLQNRKLRARITQKICDETTAILVQMIGNVAAFYRPSPEGGNISESLTTND
jgi:RNA-binding protein